MAVALTCAAFTASSPQCPANGIVHGHDSIDALSGLSGKRFDRARAESSAR